MNGTVHFNFAGRTLNVLREQGVLLLSLHIPVALYAARTRDLKSPHNGTDARKVEWPFQGA